VTRGSTSRSGSSAGAERRPTLRSREGNRSPDLEEGRVRLEEANDNGVTGGRRTRRTQDHLLGIRAGGLRNQLPRLDHDPAVRSRCQADRDRKPVPDLVARVAGDRILRRLRHGRRGPEAADERKHGKQSRLS